MSFPKDFVWGAATASYQIEGTAFTDGGGWSVWDMFCRKPGAVFEGHTGDVGCDHYHRYKEDVVLMKEIGLQAYRFSLSWPRLLPEGVGRVNEKGIDFYSRLLDTLLEADIEPWVTLFHWDYPDELYKRGGWLNPKSPEWFAEYTELVVKRLGDRVKRWMTLNEPQCFIGLGMSSGVHAPGNKLQDRQVAAAAHNVLLAHGKAVQVLRANLSSDAQIGMAPVGNVHYPASEKPEDIEAARTHMFTCDSRKWWSNSWWMDPVFKGEYPEDGLQMLDEAAPEVAPGDMETINQPLDFYGVNIYAGEKVKAGANGQPEVVPFPPGYPRTNLNWPVTPEALYWGPKFLYERYGKPIAVTENGMAGVDWVSMDGKVHDPQRIDLAGRYLREYRRAAEDGVPLLGYFLWSLMDNFEWAEGFNRRFGMIYVDYSDGTRTLKDSAYWYRDVIASHGENL